MQDGLKTRLMNYALEMLDHMKMSDATVSFLSFTHNAVFSVQYESERYILKVNLNNTRHVQEVALLRQLDEKGILAPQVVHQIQTYATALLTKELRGESRTNDSITDDDMRRIGQYLATLHNADLETDGLHHLDWEGLFGDTGVYYPGDDNMQVFTDEQLATIARVTEQVSISMDALAHDTGLIHGDFLLKNLLFDGDTLHALDWEYAGWGYYLYDLTPVLWQLKPSTRYADLEAALWDSYITHRPEAEQYFTHLEAMIAGRQVASIRWVAANQDNPYMQGKVEQILQQRTDELSQFLETSVLTRQ